MFLNFTELFLFQKCPAGYYCPTVADMPKPCPLGYYTNSTGSTACKICPQGSRCETVSFLPVACASGYYSAAGNITCAACLAGYQCVNGAPPSPCSIGKSAPVLLNKMCLCSHQIIHWESFYDICWCTLQVNIPCMERASARIARLVINAHQLRYHLRKHVQMGITPMQSDKSTVLSAKQEGHVKVRQIVLNVQRVTTVLLAICNARYVELAITGK